MSLHIINHPLLKHKMTILRSIDTKHQLFRQLVSEITLLVTYEISRNVALQEIEVTTPMTKTIGYELKDEVTVVPVLRAGLGMVEGITTLFPKAYIAHVGMYRDPKTLVPQVYYKKFPKNIKDMDVYIVDPLLATGGSILATIDILRQEGIKKITVVSLIGVDEGVDLVLKKYPEVEIYLAAKDEHLNNHSYIEPGLGDAGDRLFGTL